MKNKTICEILVVSIALVIVVSGITVGSSSTIYVPDHNSTIQEAVDEVPAGGTIIVREDTYTENVHVNKRLTIKSEKGPDKTIVHAFEVTADYVEIIGFTVKGSAGEGIYLMNADHCNISDNVVSGFYTGINLNSSSKNNITNNIVSGHHGIYLSSSSNNNTLLNNNASNNDNQGITIESSSNNKIINNIVSNNWIGIMLENSNSNNMLINNVSSNAYGIFMRRSNSNSLTNNTAIKSGMDGMYLGYSSSNNITNNICLNNNFKDIRLICSSHNNLTNNRGNIFLRISSHNNLTDNRAGGRDLGIYLGSSSNYNTLINNIVSGTINGIYLNASSNYNNLTNNIASNNKYGILLLSSRNNTLTNNTLAENSYGIYLDSSGNNSLTINNVSDNNYGITLLALSNNNTITKNIVNSNKYHGFQLESLSNDVTGNNASNNGWGGIVLSYLSNNSITNNTASNNLRGICISYCANNTVTGNIALDNTDTGIYLESSNNNTIYNNYFNNTNNSYDNGNNTWNISKTRGMNIVDGPYLGGNYWSDYDGTDLDGDMLGDTLLHYNCSGGIQNGGDWHPLIKKPKIILKASKDGYASVQHEVDNDENFERIEISGKVTDKSTGEPLEGATVKIVKGADLASTTTGADGTYSITAVIPDGTGSDTKEDINFELPPAEYIVGVYEITSEVLELIEENNGTIIDQCQYEDGPRALLVYISKEENIDDFIDNVGSSPLVRYVEPNRIVHVSYVPNDPRYPDQWGPQNIHAGGPPNPSAWDVETGDKNITIAIVDTGIQYNHEDLNCSNDGTIKYVYGYDWVSMDDDPSPVMTIENHGTHCTGIATAVMDNGKGIAGIAPNCSFIAERGFRMVEQFDPAIGWYWDGKGQVWNFSRAIMDAADHDADIISMSFGSPDYSEFERDTTLYASSLGCILIAASGNGANAAGYAGGIDFPAAYPWVIAVGANNQQNLRAPFSQWGPELELVAPGVSIWSTVPWNDYDYMSGTSMAAPHVAGVAALVKSRAERWPLEPLATDPWYHLNNNQIRQVLVQSAVDLGSPSWDKEYGYGRIDAGRAVRCVNISGNVLEAVLNAPIPGVEVRVTSIEGPPGVYTTNENTALARITKDGEYYIRVPPGVYSICAMAQGYMPSRGLGGERMELPAFDLNGHLYKEYRDLHLLPLPCNVSGTATDRITGLPINNANVSLDGPPHIYPPYPNVKMKTETNASGKYHFILTYGVHPGGLYNISVSKSGYLTKTQNFTLNWSNVITDYYKCPLSPQDYNPPIVNFSLLSGPSELPDLTLTSDDIRVIHSPPNSTPSTQQEQTTLTKDIYTPKADLNTIENLIYLPTVNPNQTFRVTEDTNYSFSTTTYSSTGIRWDLRIKADKTEVPELTVVKLTVMGVPGMNIQVKSDPVSDNAYFPGGLNDNPKETTNEFDDVIDSDGIGIYAVEFNDTGTYTIKVLDKNDPSTYTDTVDITVTDKAVIFDVPDIVIIGERFTIKGTANTGDTVTIAVEDEVVHKLDALVIAENGEFKVEIDTSAGDAPAAFTIPGSVRLRAYIGRPKASSYPDTIGTFEKEDGAIAVLMTIGELTAELSTNAVAQGYDFTITGYAKGSKSVDILIVAPEGFSGSNIEGGKGMYHSSTSVTTSDDSFYKKISVGDDVDTGAYLVMVLSPGSDGVWDKSGYPMLYNSSNPTDLNSALGQYTLDTMTQEEMLDAVEGSTYLCDDLLWIDLKDVESSYVLPATISATIHNIGTVDASNIVVQFFDGNPDAGGTQIGTDQTISCIAHESTETAQVTWTAIPGTHDIFVRVDPYDSIQEASENNNQAHKPITIEQTYNQPPIASSTYSPLNPIANETIMFNATNSYDPDGFIVNYEWDFGDDIAATGEIVEHSYSKPGDYTVILRVTDNDNVSNTNTMIVTITMVETAVCGDVTGDNNVTMGDTRRIEMWLLYPVDYPINNLWAADVTGDGEVTGDDARRIIMWLSDPEQYPLACSTP